MQEKLEDHGKHSKYTSVEVYTPRITSKIGLLPVEILEEVFCFICPRAVIIPSVEFDALWSATQTCSRWRTLALGLRRLWNHLNITLQEEDRADRAMMYFTRQCLLRSQDAPLFIEITEEAPYLLIDVHFLVPYSNRIQRLAVRSQRQISLILLPILESLHMNTLPSDYDLPEKTPSLLELRIAQCLPQTAVELISRGVIWPSLRSIECSIYSANFVGHFLDMLESRAGIGSGSIKQISDVVVRCWNFKITDEQLNRVRSLAQNGVRVIVEERYANELMFASTSMILWDIQRDSYDEGYYF